MNSHERREGMRRGQTDGVLLEDGGIGRRKRARYRVAFGRYIISHVLGVTETTQKDRGYRFVTALVITMNTLGCGTMLLPSRHAWVLSHTDTQVHFGAFFSNRPANPTLVDRDDIHSVSSMGLCCVILL